jgi:hypothetical protein
MVSPPYQGKPCPPKIQLYFYCTFYFKYVQVFFMIFVLSSLPLVSYNVCVIMNPRDLRQLAVGRLRHLALKGYPLIKLP